MKKTTTPDMTSDRQPSPKAVTVFLILSVLAFALQIALYVSCFAEILSLVGWEALAIIVLLPLSLAGCAVLAFLGFLFAAIGLRVGRTAFEADLYGKRKITLRLFRFFPFAFWLLSQAGMILTLYLLP